MNKMNTVLNEWKDFLIVYKFALDEINTKLKILNENFQFVNGHNPIEHVKSRLKTPESIIDKLNRKGYEVTTANAKKFVKDIAGIRITCSFVSDIYRIYNMLEQQDDITVVKKKDYLKNPKANGYQSLHLIIEIPVFLTDRREPVLVEVQIRTIAMDFWASLEHKIYYKFNQNVPNRLLSELKNAADQVTYLDKKMESIKDEMDNVKSSYENQNVIRLDDYKLT
ncbi:GTP pyrophosphokinase family protein [Radiobacillus sp. PE A8.2]|uniref:GTP pyrophosphokinase n=1 Tax=Radiobacillus sp. PE A8.2 TaxID=3380349 RepID=UPI00388D62A3